MLGILLLFSRRKIRRYFNFRVKQCECQAVHYSGFKSVSNLAGVVITISVGLLLDKLVDKYGSLTANQIRELYEKEDAYKQNLLCQVNTDLLQMLRLVSVPTSFIICCIVIHR